MDTKVAVLERERTETLPTQPAQIPLADVLAEVRRDSQADPKRYLDETVVPHGGE